MMHTGDQYEARARAARHYELSRLTKAVAGILFGAAAPTSRPMDPTGTLYSANDQTHENSRAA